MISSNKFDFISLIFFMCLLFIIIRAEEEFYNVKLEYYDVDSLMENPRLLKKYLDCFLEEGPCTPIGRVFRQLLPEIVSTACKKCTRSQRRLARRYFNAYKWYFPESYERLMFKLDPKNKYYEAFEKAINES